MMRPNKDLSRAYGRTDQAVAEYTEQEVDRPGDVAEQGSLSPSNLIGYVKLPSNLVLIEQMAEQLGSGRANCRVT